MATILLVDDSATSRMLFRRCIPAGAPFELYEANDGESAIAKALALRPDAVVLDYNLAAANGVSVARDIRDAGVATKFVLLTANTQRTVVTAAQELGFRAVLEKPITSDTVAAILRVLAE
jgi:response regulator NasT